MPRWVWWLCQKVGYNLKSKVFLVWGPFVVFLRKTDQWHKTFEVPLVINFLNIFFLELQPGELYLSIAPCILNVYFKLFIDVSFKHRISCMMMILLTLPILCSMYLRFACPVKNSASILQCSLSNLFLYWTNLSVGSFKQISLILYLSQVFH